MQISNRTHRGTYRNLSSKSHTLLLKKTSTEIRSSDDGSLSDSVRQQKIYEVREITEDVALICFATTFSVADELPKLYGVGT